MLRPIVRYGALSTLLASTAAVWLSAGCNGRDMIIAVSKDAGAPPTFVEPDAAAPQPNQTLTEYCPSTSCPAPYTTCPSSEYPCDINLMTDAKNSGSCGFQCKGSGNAVFGCVEGSCTFKCKAESGTSRNSWTADCNGIIDDDCEVILGSNEHCNGCGDKCPDPAAPCMFDPRSGHGKCGCDPGELLCGGACADPKSNDAHCGQCGKRCAPDFDADGGAPPPNMYFGCGAGECGVSKCKPGFADCDDDLTNGCESHLASTDSCGACGVVCAPGQFCQLREGGPVCACAPGETLCGDTCSNLSKDPHNCGSCGRDCFHLGRLKTNVWTCDYGSCVMECRQGWGDCNGNLQDGCEADLSFDPLNCGACGNACSPGQPCVGGSCAVQPCEPSEGEAR